MAQTPVWRPASGFVPGRATRFLGFLGFHGFLFLASLQALLLAALLAPLSAHAFTLSDGNEVQCHFKRDDTGATATERWVDYKTPSERDPELGKAVAVVRFDPQDRPTILIDAVAYKQSKGVMAAMWDFIFFHECAHAKDKRLSEIGANCAAYIEMQDRGLMNAIRFKDIEAAHLRIMALPEQYGGNGMEFWRMTLDCVERERGRSNPGAAVRSAQSAADARDRGTDQE